MSEASSFESSVAERHDARRPLATARLGLSPWGEHHREPFAALHADAVVMADLGGPLDGAASDAKFARYRAAAAAHGISRWAIEDSGTLLGYAGVMFRADEKHPLGAHHEVGWRLARHAWGRGFATESAAAALADALGRGVGTILSYTARDNLRSQAVMVRLGLVREPALDFTADYGRGAWHGLVWAVRSATGGELRDGQGRGAM